MFCSHHAWSYAFVCCSVKAIIVLAAPLPIRSKVSSAFARRPHQQTHFAVTASGQIDIKLSHIMTAVFRTSQITGLFQIRTETSLDHIEREKKHHWVVSIKK